MIINSFIENFAHPIPTCGSADAIHIRITSTRETNLVLNVNFSHRDGPSGDAYLSLWSDEGIMLLPYTTIFSETSIPLKIKTSGLQTIKIDFPGNFQINGVKIICRSEDDSGASEIVFSECRHRDSSSHRFERLRAHERFLASIDAAETDSEMDLIFHIEDLKAFLDQDILFSSPGDYWPLVELIQTQGRNEKDSFDSLSIEVISAMALCAINSSATGYLQTRHLRVFKDHLRTSEALGEFINALNRRAALVQIGQKKYVMSKHCINPSWLETNIEKYLSLLDDIFRMLGPKVANIVVCYGTLLGARRGRKFIPHDDDVDLLYWSGATNKVEALAHQVEIQEYLRSCGFSVDSNEGLIHLNVQKNGGSCDLFPSWLDADGLHLMMQSYQESVIESEIVWPSRGNNVELYDREYPAPRMVDRFLELRYGQNWFVSDPFHEWPWVISR